jgi:DNA repair protein NreA
MAYCKICDSYTCKHQFPIGKIRNITEFSGSSPPEIFVGSYNYPNVFAGILSPQEHGDTSIFSSPELWHQKRLSIPEIISNRQKLIYARTSSHVKKQSSKYLSSIKEVAMTHKSIAAEFKLRRPVQLHKENNPKVPLISNSSEIKELRFQENVQVKPKVDYLINDNVKSTIAISELAKSNIETSTIIKILSAGLLGLKKNRKLVPTKWAITATDDTLSKEYLKKIRSFSEIDQIYLFHAEYIGNHYEFLLLPGKWSFEVIEISIKNQGIWQDYESFLPRKNYASDVTGAYYANRLALTEYLTKIKRQCQCIVFRQISNEYDSPLGVGILRQTSRDAFSRQPEKFDTIKESLEYIQKRLKISIDKFASKSLIIRNYGKQKKITQFL